MNGELWRDFLMVGIGSFLLTVLLSKIIIPILRGKKIGQSIREEGPEWHQSKAGTPTMGGICFIMAMLLATVGIGIFYFFQNRQSELIPLVLTLGLAVANGLIGFVDDYCKLLKKQNEGLKAYQKLILQVLVAVLYLLALRLLGHLDTALPIPFTPYCLELSYFYDVFAIFLIVGMVNAVNLTDGLDGLASTITLIISAFFAVVAFAYLHVPLTILSASLIGGMLGFLIFNHHPAQVFMGDTGSLFLGGVLTGAAFLMDMPLIIVIAGGIFLLEAVSVMLQVGFYKLTHKRIFKMAPIHHHFEKCGWSEWRVVIVFGSVTVVLCALAWFAL